MSSNEPGQTGQLAAEFDDACVATAQARGLVFQAGARVLARIAREHFPAAATAVVEPSSGALVGIDTSTGPAWSAFWNAPNNGLPLPALEEAHRVLAGMLAFGSDHKTVTAAGWVPVPSDEDLFHVALPGAPASEQQRETWSVETIRAVDVVANDEVMINGRWREVLDAWGDDDDPALQFGEDHPYTAQILAKCGRLSPTYMAFRLADDEQSTFDEVVDELIFVRCRDLVNVQRKDEPAPAEDGPLTDVRALMSDLDLLGALRAGTELWAETGDPQDDLSSSQRDNLDALRRHFTSLDAL
ncbi:hypothetical protein [Streptomyces sp. NPDC059916]|uniref:hypothetical protein n=1 Tax=Streptomyces sp. NPDC059916 TaxID=3347001 RepID=UPI0036CC3444